ncbi:MAG: phosphate ABC transporter, permease protein PstA, partial [Nitrospirae bacterium CG17_big_fil_post_rev_8_21_14_2_50_50_9]
MQDLKKRIRYNKLWNSLFLIVGFLSTMVGLILLCALMIDLAMDGAPRLSYKFLTSFPSRFPDEAGILSAWVGSFLLLLVTALAAIPLGVAAGIYLEEYGK